MASIRNSISLTDRMTPTLRSIMKSVDSTLRALERVDKQTNSGVTSRAYNQAEKAIKRANNEIIRMGNYAVLSNSKIQGSTDQSTRKMGALATAASRVGSAMGSMSNKANTSLQSLASGIYVIKNVAKALSTLTGLIGKSTSDMAKLNLQNYSGITSGQAYGLAYQAAQATGSDISDTSNLASRISMSGVYGNQKGSLESSIKMAETIQKALALGGGTAEENSRAILQLSQGLSSGVLQGDELRSIREQSPYLADMLAQGLAKVDSSFIGTTAGDLKKLGSEGKLTSEVVIKAFEAMEEQIDQTFEEKYPFTWGQGVTSIVNTFKYFLGILKTIEGGPLEKISNLIWMISDYLQSSEGMQILSGIAIALGVVGDVLSFIVGSALNLVSWLMDNSWMLIAIFTVLGAVALASGISALIGWLAATWPLFLIIAIVALVIYAFMSMGASIEEIVGVITGIFSVLGAIIGNIFVSAINFVIDVFVVLWNFIASFVNFFANVFNDPITAIKRLFFDLVDSALGLLQSLASVIDTLFGSNLAGSVEGWRDDLSAWVDAKYGKGEEIMAKLDSTDLHVQRFEYGEAWNSGYDWGHNLVNKVADMELNLDNMFDPEKLGASLDVESVSVDGGYLDGIKSDVSISDEDIKLLRDATAREFLLQLQSVTPTAHITFGDVRETADVGKIVEVIEQMVEEQMATALVS